MKNTAMETRQITIDPNVRGGRPCIANTSLRVTDVAIAALFHGRTPGEIASDYGISQAQVHAALASQQTSPHHSCHLRSRFWRGGMMGECLPFALFLRSSDTPPG